MATASNYSPQIVIEDNGINFVALVNDALETIASEPWGKRMLDEIIANAPGIPKWGGAKLNIIWPFEKQWEEGSAVNFQIRNYGPSEAGNKAKAVSVPNARNGKGSASNVYWNPHNQGGGGTGVRPTFIGLAHELVHAWHNAKGTMKSDYDDEENFTVGIGNYAGYDQSRITENMIRVEHNLPIRHNY